VSDQRATGGRRELGVIKKFMFVNRKAPTARSTRSRA